MFATHSSKYDRNARGPDRRARALRRTLLALIASVCAFALPVSPAFGEGSVDVNTGPDANSRHGLTMASGGNFGGDSYTVLYVYAQAGETIQLGSSAMAEAGTNIQVYAPGTTLEGLAYPSDPALANDVFDCRTNDPGTGVIADGAAGRAQELAGPLPNLGGYNPCEFTPTTTGIFPVIMTSPDPGAAGGVGTVGVPAQAANSWAVAIWDITVRNSAGVQTGRVFSNQFSFWETTSPSGGVQVFPYTRTGYEYDVQMFNHNGAGWSLRADDQGIVNSATGDRLFSSFDCRLNPGDAANVCSDTRAGFAAPEGRYPLFVNRADPIVITGPGGLATTRGYATAAISPASNPLVSTFTGSGGQSGATNHGSGGTIDVTSPAQMAGLGSTLEIDINRNGTFGDAPDYVDTADLETDGSSAYAWNGRDAAANVPACGDYQYRVRSTLAEVHFPMYDVETSGGTRIERLSLPGDASLGDPLAAYYDDRDPFKNRNVTDANPIQVDAGTSSATFHPWGDESNAADVGGGDTDFIDTWAQLPEVQATGTLRLLCADVQVVKSAEPSPAVAGEDLTFHLEVTNNGAATATNVVATDDLPDTVTFKSASQGCAEAGGTVTCSLASLAANATHTFEIVAAVPSSATECIANTAAVANATPDPNMANNSSAICVPVEGRSGVLMTKNASSATVAPGGQVMYTLVVENKGPSDDRDVKVTDPLPAGLTLVAAEASQGTCETANNTVACELGMLKNGGSAQVLVTVTAPGTAGCITNTARSEGANEDPTPADNQASAQICVVPPPTPPATFDLAVDKRANPTRVMVGQRVTYTIVVSNNGPDAAPDAKVTDTFNNRGTLVSVSTTAGSCVKAIPMTCSLGRIESGASVTITVVIKPRVSGRARNAASATSCCGNDRVPNNNLDTADITVRKVALKVSKVASRSSVAAGDTLNYRIRVRNPSRVAARNVKVCDRLPSGMAFVSSSPKAKRSGSQRCWTGKSLKAGKSRTFRVKVRAARGANGRKVNRATLSGSGIKPAAARSPVRVRGVATPVTG